MREIKVSWSRYFTARFRRLSHRDRRMVAETIEAFRENPLSPPLGNHTLRGSMSAKRAISVNHDLRIIFTVKGDYEEVRLLDIGTHEAVYRQ